MEEGLQAKDRGPSRSRNRPENTLLRSLQGTQPCWHPDSSPRSPQSSDRPPLLGINLCCSKSLTSWSFVTAAPGHASTLHLLPLLSGPSPLTEGTCSSSFKGRLLHRRPNTPGAPLATMSRCPAFRAHASFWSALVFPPHVHFQSLGPSPCAGGPALSPQSHWVIPTQKPNVFHFLRTSGPAGCCLSNCGQGPAPSPKSVVAITFVKHDKDATAMLNG